MAADPFASSIVSLILAWVCALPLLASAAQFAFGALFSKLEGTPRWFVWWVLFTSFLLGPLRYIFLQMVLSFAYPVQSFGAFISSIVLAVYVPVLFGVLYAIGLGIPLMATLWVAFGSLSEPRVTRVRLLAGAVVAPIAAFLGGLLFFWALTYASLSTHWLDAKDVMRATNGPSLFAYRLTFKYLPPRLPASIIFDGVTASDRDKLRNHVASYYLGRGQVATYLRLAYPALYDSLTGSQSH